MASTRFLFTDFLQTSPIINLQPFLVVELILILYFRSTSEGSSYFLSAGIPVPNTKYSIASRKVVFDIVIKTCSLESITLTIECLIKLTSHSFAQISSRIVFCCTSV